MKFIKECEGRLIKYGCVFLLSEARFMSLQGGGGGGGGTGARWQRRFNDKLESWVKFGT